MNLISKILNMRKQKFFESKTLSGPDSSPMDFDGGKKSLNDIMVLRMLYLDYFFLFLGMNAATTAEGTLKDPQ